MTDKKSFLAVDMWMSEVDKFASESVLRLLVANKCDAEDRRKVSYEEGKDLASRYGINFMETSAKSSINVVETFISLAKDIKVRMLPKQNKETVYGTKKDPKKLTTGKGKKIKKDSGCC